MALGAAALGWPALAAPHWTVLGTSLLVVGFVTGVFGVRVFWRGAMRVCPNRLNIQTGSLRWNPVSVDVSDIVSIARHSRRWTLRDPMQVFVAFLTNQSGIEVRTSTGVSYVSWPVSPQQAEKVLAESLRDAPEHTTRPLTWPLPITLATVAIVCGLAAISGSHNDLSVTVLLCSAGILELSFWCSLIAGYRRRVEFFSPDPAK